MYSKRREQNKAETEMLEEAEVGGLVDQIEFGGVGEESRQSFDLAVAEVEMDGVG